MPAIVKPSCLTLQYTIVVTMCQGNNQAGIHPLTRGAVCCTIPGRVWGCPYLNNNMDKQIEDIKRLAGIVEQDQSGHQAKIQQVSALLATVLRAIESGNVDTLRHMQRDVIAATNTLSEVLRDLQHQEQSGGYQQMD